MSALRVGIIGFGRWAPNLARNFAKHATIAWIADNDTAARQRALEAGYAVTDERGAFENGAEPVDAIVIATPIATHSRLAHRAIEAGKHVLCEKPLTTVAEVARNLGEFAKHRGVTLMVDHTWTAHPAIQRGAELASDLGAPLWYRAARTSWDERNLDPLADLLPHDVSIMRAWGCGDVREVTASVSNGHTASVTMLTDRGVLATVQYSYRDRDKQRETALGGEHGVLSCDGTRLRLSASDKRIIVADCDYAVEPLDAMAAEFVRSATEGTTPRYGTIDEAIHVAAVIEAAHMSVRERCTVRL